MPGDIIVGDEDGVVAFAPEKAAQLLTAVNAQIEREAQIMQSIADGTYKGSYGATSKS